MVAGSSGTESLARREDAEYSIAFTKYLKSVSPGLPSKEVSSRESARANRHAACSLFIPASFATRRVGP
jgi:hypothetical protein